MTSIRTLLAAGALALAACTGATTGTTPALTTGGSAGAMGPGYCDSPPADPDAIEEWNERCLP